ncbi:ExeA family protein [Burkholderia gladioli]|uniref:ExeA family protein n=1 Tax=Burkholderia gladioli TaxID=28095 RepID=UPI00192D55A6|nr:AAA family ATPase [Burkholderia gladioli]
MSSSIAAVMAENQILQTDLGRATGMSRSATSRFVAHGQLPKRNSEKVRRAALEYLKSRGVDLIQLRDLVLPPKMAPDSSHLSEAAPATPKPLETTEVEAMLLRNENLTQETRKHFGLPRSPFMDDVASRDDVYQTASIRYVRAALMDAATNHGFIGVVAESGAGKSTLVEELEERLQDDKRDVLIVKPYTLAMEANDRTGKTMKSLHIAEALTAALAPDKINMGSPQARFKQLHELLKASHRAGRQHLVVIEEAHCLPLATLKHLKRFLELKDGLRRLLGIALIGQPELAIKLASQNPEVREVAQRCELVNLPPLDDELEGYLRHKFARFEFDFDKVFDRDAIEAIRARLVYVPRGAKPTDAISICYPLVVNNLVSRAMNAAARAGYPKLDAAVIAGC